MQMRSLGSSGLQLTTIGLGTWAIGGGDWKMGWGPQDEREAVDAILHGVALGINWIDTAAAYGVGKSEVLVGRAVRQIPANDRPLVATKCGRVVQPDGSILPLLEPQSIRDECDASLRRLQLEAIDLYQIHWPEPDEKIEAAWQTLVELKQQGKVRQIGVSNHSVEQLQRLATIHPVASLQPPYSMLRRSAEEQLFPYCQREGVGVICYSPMAKGLLTGQFSASRAAALDATDHRSRDPDFTPPRLTTHLQLVDKLRPVAEPRSLAQLAIAWVLRRPEVTAAIVGARRPSQIEETVAASDWQLAPEDAATIEECLSQHARSLGH